MAQNYILLERIELNQSASSVTFASIPQTGYTDLKIVVSGRGATNAAPSFYVLLNNNGSSVYTTRTLKGDGSGTSSGSLSSTFFRLDSAMDGTTDTANTFTNQEIYIPNYTSSSYKSLSFDSVSENNATGARMYLAAGLFSNTTPVSSVYIGIDGTFAVGSTFSLYGIANASTTPAIAPKADGGNVIATDGTYWYHAFVNSGTFTPQLNLTADVLVVAGGGGTVAASGAGGAGAGGLLGFTGQTLTATGYTCTVGAGGAAGAQGGSSQFGALTATVGGGIGNGSNPAGSGGSGAGGAAAAGYAGGSGTSGQGFAGGTGASNGSGGGGGSGQAGANGTTGTGGVGGNGTTAYSSWGLATNTGQNVGGTVYYAGGGGGWQNSPRGGYGGGASQAGAGTPNTGGGGGGYGSGTGGSGIIIIRYPVA